MAGIMGVIMLVTAMITIFTVKEPPRAVQEAREQQNLVKSYLAALRNRPFLMALFTYALHICGTSIVQGALIYYFKYIYADKASLEIALALLLVPVIPSIWMWTAVSKRIGKKWAYNIGMGIVVVAVFAIFLFAEQLGPTFFYVVMAVAGIGFATNYVMPFAIVPDTVELDYAENGVRREGIFYGLWNFMNKVGVALANLINGLILTAFGYIANVQQTALSRLGIRMLVGPVAAVFFIAGILVLSFYPISKKYYEQVILPKVAAREAGAR